MKSDIEEMQELVREVENILSRKNCFFSYDVYVKVDSALFLNYK